MAARSLIAHIFVLCISLVLILGVGRVNGQCNYAASCTGASLSSTSRLSASCPNCNGVVLGTAVIDLNQRVINNNGNLQCLATGGNFAASCSNIALSGSTLSASCQQSGGSTSVAASINLNNCIGNINGNLVWCVGTGPCAGMGNSVRLANSTTLTAPTAAMNLTATL